MSQDPIGSLRLRTAEGEREVEPLDRRDLYQVTLEAFAAATRGEGQPIVDGVGGVRTLAVALAVREAAETARAVEVVWRREARDTG
jgi:1,5-anhydro-D-fructose reductase (1,5-anhydro-D-mannitol-forming)